MALTTWFSVTVDAAMPHAMKAVPSFDCFAEDLDAEALDYVRGELARS